VDNIALFQAAPGPREPWVVEQVEFDLKGGRLELFPGNPAASGSVAPTGTGQTARSTSLSLNPLSG
jgi:hypothetical protein